MTANTPYQENDGIASFLERASHSIATAETATNLTETRQNRMQRRFSIKEVCSFLDIERIFFDRNLRAPNYPQGEMIGREINYTADELMRIRVIAAATLKKHAHLKDMAWRLPGDPVPVIVAGSQKGGSGKTLLAANLTTFLSIAGYRVGLIDADPQASASLYFADDKVDVGSIDTQTFTNFMGMQAPGEPILTHDATTLNSFWKNTSWPGVRLLPGGPSIQEGDINLFFLFKDPKPDQPMFHEMLKTAIDRFLEGHQPTLQPTDIVDENGYIIEELYEKAINETMDVIVIDCAPALSLTMLNTIVAGTSLFIPTPLKGFDLSTVRAYTSSASDLISFLAEETGLQFPPMPSYIIPTIVSSQTDTDLRVLKSLMDHDASIICPVFYARSESVANAAEFHQSLYEYIPPKGRKKSAETFIRNANAVGDAIASRAVPGYRPRGYANDFIKNTYGGTVPPWTETAKKKGSS